MNFSKTNRIGQRTLGGNRLSIRERISVWVDKHLSLVFIGPAFLVVALMMFYPLVYTLYMSFHEWFVSFFITPKFVGFENYVQMFSDVRFINSIWHSFYFIGTALIIEMLIGTGMALVFNRSFRGRGMARTAFLLPMMSTPSAIALVWLMMFEPTIGFLNYFLSLFGHSGLLWLADKNLVIPSLVMVEAWQWSPLVMLIVLSGLSSLSNEPYEAASIDGASKWQVFRYITLPLLRPTLIVAIMFRLMDLWKVFDIIYVTTQGGPAWASETLNIYAWYQALKYMQMGYGSANLVVLAIIVFGCSILLTKLRRSSEC